MGCVAAHGAGRKGLRKERAFLPSETGCLLVTVLEELDKAVVMYCQDWAQTMILGRENWPYVVSFDGFADDFSALRDFFDDEQYALVEYLACIVEQVFGCVKDAHRL